MLATTVVLGFLGVCLGSFVNALVWRVHQQEKAKKPGRDLSILKGQSMCPNCRHKLAAKDLVPVFSWLWLKGRCRYCKKPISAQYPAVEAATGAVFVLSYLFWPTTLASSGEYLLFGSWLLVSVGLMALLVYDIRWMLLPNRIIYPTLLVALAGRLAYILLFSEHFLHSLLYLLASVAVASGIFWILFEVSKGKWIGFGDVRLGFITGVVLAKPSLSLLMIFVASLLGTMAAIPGLATGKKTVLSKMPFGPFLITATWLVLLFGQSFIDWYTGLL